MLPRHRADELDRIIHEEPSTPVSTPPTDKRRRRLERRTFWACVDPKGFPVLFSAKGMAEEDAENDEAVFPVQVKVRKR